VPREPMPLGRDDVPERRWSPSDCVGSAAQRWLRVDCEPNGCDVPLWMHVQRRTEHLLRRDMPTVSHPGRVLDCVRVLVEPQSVPRLQRAIRKHQLRSIDVCDNVRRQHLLLELQPEQVSVRVAQQCVRMGAAGQRRDVPRSVLVRCCSWILLQRSVCTGNDAMCLQRAPGRSVRVVEWQVLGLQPAVRRLRLQCCDEQGTVREELRVERRDIYLLVDASHRQLRLPRLYAATAQGRIA